MKHEKCEYCSGSTGQVVRRFNFRYKKETIYVDNVPVLGCRRCGEIYYEAKVYKELERVAANRQDTTAA